MKRVLAIALLAFAACKGHKDTVQTSGPTPEQAPQKPSWVLNRPAGDFDYIGIGSCPKNRPDFQESAKKNALNDLASEISVRVEGNSLLSSLDTREHFSETFNNAIKTTTNEQLEGYELVDTWQSDTEYWVYYRLNKAEHARWKAERKDKAIAQAKDGYLRATQNLVLGDLKGAFDQDLRALIAMKEYWGESDVVTIGDKQLPLANQLFADLQRLTNGVRITSLPERCSLDYANRFKREMLISAAFNEGRQNRDLVQLPLSISYPGTSGTVTEKKNTDTEGHMRTTVQHVGFDGAAELLVRLDMDALVSKELDPIFTKPVMASLTIPELHVLIDRTLPKVFVQANETNLGQPVSDAGVALGLKEELTSRGFRFADRQSDADLLLNVTSTTRQGGEANGFYTAFLDVAYSFRDRRNNETIAEGGKQGVKGIQLDYAKAGMDAYKKARQEVRKELVNSMLSTLL